MLDEALYERRVNGLLSQASIIEAALNAVETDDAEFTQEIARVKANLVCARQRFNEIWMIFRKVISDRTGEENFHGNG